MAQLTLAEHLFRVLRANGVEHCFGIPGDYVLPLYKALESVDGISSVVATHEPCAAYSADAYSRIRGLGALIVTYGVGAFNALNGVACAFAESSPLLVVSGAPPSSYRDSDDPFAPQYHHVVKRADSQRAAFSEVTDLSLRIDRAGTAADIIARAVGHARRAMRPVYLEIPSDLMRASIPGPTDATASERDDEAALRPAVELFLERIAAARTPVLLVGAEMGRYRLQPALRAIIRSQRIPVVLDPTGKGVLAETEEGCLGVYAGVLSLNPQVRHLVETADVVIMLGTKVTDVNCGAFTADLDRNRVLIATSDYVGDGHVRMASHLSLRSFVVALADALSAGPTDRPEVPRRMPFDYGGSRSVMDRYLGAVEAQLTDSDVVIADTGDACYGSLFLQTRREAGYLAPLFYNTMGFAVPAAVGVQLADPHARPVVLVGDGAFQMTGMEVSTMLRHGLDPIIIVFNNGGYGMQRVFEDGPFNDLTQWNYTRVVDLVGGGTACRVESPDALAEALRAARRRRHEFSLIEAAVPKGEISTGLRVFTDAVKREKTGRCPMQIGGIEACEHHPQCAFCRAPIWS